MYCNETLVDAIGWQLRFDLVLIDSISQSLSLQNVFDALEHVFMRQEVEFAVSGFPWDLCTKVTLRLADDFLVWTVDCCDSWVGQILNCFNFLILLRLALVEMKVVRAFGFHEELLVAIGACHQKYLVLEQLVIQFWLLNHKVWELELWILSVTRSINQVLPLLLLL